MRRYAAVVVMMLLSVVRVVCAQATASHAAQGPSAGELQAEAARADTLTQQQNFIGALPLYEDLHAREPMSLKLQERLAMCLLASAAQQPPGKAAATRQRAKELLVDAQAKGDQSNLLQVLLEGLNSGAGPAGPPAAGQDWVDKGEKDFSNGKLPEALADYREALKVNPKLYSAALFAGDVEFKQNHFDAAGQWFQEAIAIDPNVETAYRYWGDSLERAGEHGHAKDEFIAAIVAEPYRRAPRIGLQQWANANHAHLLSPPITLPAEPTSTAAKGSSGKPEVKITLPSGKDADSAEMTLALAYSMRAALWHGDKFKQQFPAEAAYRHSLAEEAESVRTMLAVAKEQKLPDPKLSSSVRLLRELDQAGMLECWILLDNADAGIAKDYPAFREGHRALLAKYVATYDVHTAEVP